MNQKSSVTPVETEEELDNYIQQSQDLLIGTSSCCFVLRFDYVAMTPLVSF